MAKFPFDPPAPAVPAASGDRLEGSIEGVGELTEMIGERA